MIRQTINQNWQMHCVEEQEWIPAIVPGSVYKDYLENGKMEDPFWKDNEEKALALMEKDYEYKTVFSCEEEMKKCDRLFLHFYGVDTLADITLNGICIGKINNMHREWEFDVTDLLKDQDNELKVYFHSPTRFIQEAFEEAPTRGSEDAMNGFVHIRKAHCMFGWDWGAHLPDAGIYRPVELQGVNQARLDSFYVTQKHENDKVTLGLEVTCDWVTKEGMQLKAAVLTKEGLEVSAKTDASVILKKPGVQRELPELTYQVEITDPDGKVSCYEGCPDSILIDDPQLWWPNGYGKQLLYTVKVTLLAGDQILDSCEKKIGLRTMTMKREKDQWGESFAATVNGISIFAMGADYIPEDHLLGRVTPETTRDLLTKAQYANFNSVRVWGGGYYPENWFYEICDELGLIVWQDFMFACGVYDLTPEFEENIRAEFIDNVKRLRHHASLGLWCGNNEMETFVVQRNWVSKDAEVRDYLFMYERVIPEILKEYDPQTFYWPASPSSGGSFDAPDDPNRGDVHYWDVWHGNKPFSEYRKFFFRYVSEFGFQSFPSERTIEMFTDDPADKNIFSYIMEKHQRNGAANGKILNYMQQTYLYPTSFSALIYASQLLQADAIRYGVEHFRRNRGRCMGAIYWQLNDCWPVASWSSVDYGGRLKALHYYAKRFFAPIMVSCEEQGMMSAGQVLNWLPFEFEKSIRLNVANESRSDVTGTLIWQLRNADASIVREESMELTVPALTSNWAEKVMLPEVDIYNQYVSYAFVVDGEAVSEGTVIFSYPKYFRFQNPNLTWKVEGDEIVVTADVYARSVEISNEKDDLILSDNFFDMNGGEKRVKVLKGDVSSLKVRSVYDIR